jgi:hypothetical protein
MDAIIFNDSLFINNSRSNNLIGFISLSKIKIIFNNIVISNCHAEEEVKN